MSVKKTNKIASLVGDFYVVGASFFYAFYGVWIKVMGDFLGIFTQSVIRALVVVVVLTTIAQKRNDLEKIHWKRDFWLLLGLLITSLFASAPLFIAVKSVGIGIGISVTYLGIILGAFLFGKLFNHEKLTVPKYISAFIGIIGLLLIYIPSQATFEIVGILFALLSGISAGANMAITKKIPYNSKQTTILTWGATIIVNLPLIFIFKEVLPVNFFDIHYLYLVGFGLTSLLASWLVISGLKLIDAGLAGILGLLEIVFAVLLGVLFFAEKPTPLALFGIVLIIISAGIPYFQKK